MIVVAIILISLFLLTAVSGVYVFVVACLRRKEMPWLVEEELKNTQYLKYYPHIVAADKWLKEHNAQDVYIQSKDGLKLHGLWVPAPNSRGTVLFAHGYRSTILLDFGMAMDFYHQQGINLLIPDQRAHGRSEGRFITFGVKESEDMRLWIQYHNQSLSNAPVILSGLSMGASTMMYLADKELPENVKAIIADCGFTCPKDILSSVFTNVTHLPAAPSLWVTDICARIFAGFRLKQEDSRKTLAKNRLPILMVHGREDGFVPCKMTEEGYAICAGPKELLLVEGADHGLSFIVERDRYTAMIHSLLEAVLGGQNELRDN